MERKDFAKETSAVMTVEDRGRMLGGDQEVEGTLRSAKG